MRGVFDRDRRIGEIKKRSEFAKFLQNPTVFCGLFLTFVRPEHNHDATDNHR